MVMVYLHLCPHCVLKAFLQLSNEKEARAMASFYNGNVMPSVCGKQVKIYHSQTYPTIQVRLNELNNLNLSQMLVNPK